MTLHLSEQQRQALEAGKPVEVADGSRTLYVLSKDAYERVRGLLELEDIDPSFYEAGEIQLHEE